MRIVSLIVAVFTLLLMGAGCSSSSKQQSFGTHAKDWQKSAPPQTYLDEMKSHPPGPPSVHGGPPPAAPPATGH
ncbi:MAG TPA: hypothetical protein VFW40_13910 [Capsulimonadaceae bacterium]|nr:hypothetical protein [Capsulimonadaceae bacterium]